MLLRYFLFNLNFDTIKSNLNILVPVIFPSVALQYVSTIIVGLAFRERGGGVSIMGKELLFTSCSQGGCWELFWLCQILKSPHTFHASLQVSQYLLMKLLH